MARWVAKNIVDFYGVKDCFVQLSYANFVKELHRFNKCENEVRHDLIDRIVNEIDVVLIVLGITIRFELGSVTEQFKTNKLRTFW